MDRTLPASSVDLLLLGGGLANGLISFALGRLRPELRLLLLERGGAPSKTWCFHATDLTSEELAWLEPCIDHSWLSHEVRFGGYRRVLPGAYHAIRSDLFQARLRAELGERFWGDAEVVEATADGARLADGREIRARCVIDGRGAEARPPLGFQKFHGLELLLDSPHGLERPILMDAACPQTDGYRFFYALPWSEASLLLEETFYSDAPDLDDRRESILGHARTQGWRVARVEREERGVLAIPLGAAPLGSGLPCSGTRAGLFHATTGYSLPWSVRFALELARLPELTSEAVLEFQRDWTLRHWRSGRFFRLLNRMLFRAAEPERRVRIFERFYRLAPGLIERFYAGRLTWLDRARILIGRPPVPVGRAIQSIFLETST